jgi:hypothetical protein
LLPNLDIDGAYFGTAFPHMFLMTFENLVPYAPTHQYVSRIFGFKLHNSNVCVPKGMSFLVSCNTFFSFFLLVPPTDASVLSLPSLERRETYQQRHTNNNKKTPNSDDNSSQLTFEEMQLLSRSPLDDGLSCNLMKGMGNDNSLEKSDSQTNMTNLCSTSADRSTVEGVIPSSEQHLDYLTIRNEHMKTNNNDKSGASPHVDKKPRKS